MKDDDELSEEAELIESICAVVERQGAAALGHAPAEEVARQWIDAGFSDAEEIEEWLAARCFSAQGAQRLEMAGITPQQAAMRTRAGTADYEETVGYKIINGDLSLEEARRIINSTFWNS